MNAFLVATVKTKVYKHKISKKIWLVLKTTDGKRLFKKNKNNYEGPLKKDPQYAKYRPFSI